MNLDSLSFALSHISYSVANLTKKNFKSSVLEISRLVAHHGTEAEKHLLRCLFSHVDFSGDGKSSGKDFHQTQFLTQELASALKKPSFISSICHAIDCPLQQQKSLRPSTHLLSQLTKVLKLSTIQEIAFAVALLNSTNPDHVNNSARFLREIVPDFLKNLLDADSLEDFALPITVLHLFLEKLLEFQHEIGIVQDNREKILRKFGRSTKSSLTLVTFVKLYNLDAIMDASGKAKTTLQDSFVDVLQDLGYSFTNSVEECTSHLEHVGLKDLTPRNVAQIIIMMCRFNGNNSEVSPLIGLNTNNMSVWNDEKPKQDGKQSSWNIENFLQTIKNLTPSLDLDEVVSELDHPAFLIRDRKSLKILWRILTLAAFLWRDVNMKFQMGPYPMEKFYKLWKNAEAQYQFFSLVLNNPDVVVITDCAYRQVQIDALKSPPEEDNRKVANWKSLDLVEILLHLSEFPFFKDDIFQFPLTHCPDLLFLGLIQTSVTSPTNKMAMYGVHKKLIAQLMPVFLGNHPNSAMVLHLAWHTTNQPAEVRKVMMLAMAHWYYERPDDPTRLSRILDVAQDLKALSMLLSLTGRPTFVLDLACLASRREYLKLDKWLADRLIDQKDSFLRGVCEFLGDKYPEMKGGNAKDEPQPKNALTTEILGTIISFLQTCAQNTFIPTEHPYVYELILKTINNCATLLNKNRLPPPGVVKPSQVLPNTALDQLTLGLTSSVSALTIGSAAPKPINSGNSAFPPLPSALNSISIPSSGSPAKMMPVSKPTSQQQQPIQNTLPIAQNQFTNTLNSIASTLPPQFAEIASVFPDLSRPVEKDIEEECNGYFQRIYSHDPNVAMSVEEVLEVLKKLIASQIQRDKDLCSCMIKNLFEEYRFFHQYPEKELLTTAHLFGGIIENNLVNYMSLGLSLRYVLESLKKPSGSKLFFFGITALDRFKQRLKEYPQYCQHVAAIPHFHDFPPIMREYIEFGTRSEEPPSRAQPAILPPSVTNTLAIGFHDLSQAPNLTVVTPTTAAVTTTTTATKAARAAGKPSIANTTNIDTLLVATEKDEKLVIPPESIQDKVAFIVNNLSQANLNPKTDEFKEILKAEHYAWASQYLVMKRASIEPNFHSLYSNFLDTMKEQELIKMVIRETFRNIKVLLRSDKAIANFSDRSLLKNLGHWLGILTLSKCRPILQIDIDVKSLLIEAYHMGTDEMLYIVPFIAKILDSCAKSKVFKPPNPWTMGIMNVLAELHKEQDLKLNLKFEIEVLCKTLNIDINDLKPTSILKDQSVRDKIETQLSPLPKSKDQQILSAVNIQIPPQTAIIAVPNAIPVVPNAIPLTNNTSLHEEESKIGIVSHIVPAAPLSSPSASSTSSQAMPLNATMPQPQFAYGDIGIASPSNLAPLIVTNQQVSLFLAHPNLRVVVRVAVERSIQEWLAPIVDRYLKVVITTCEQLIRKDFALDPDENRMRMSAHSMTRSLAAGVVMIACQDHLLITIVNRLKQVFHTALRNPTPQQKEMIEQAVEIIAHDNVELACCFIQKTAIEKALPELDKRLNTDFEQRKHARAEGRRYCDTTVLSYQAEKMPEQIRLKVGSVTPQQMSVYEEFARKIPGFIPNDREHHTPQLQVPNNFVGKQIQLLQPPFAADELSQVYDKLISDLEVLLNIIAPGNAHLTALHNLMDAIILAQSTRDLSSPVLLLQKALESFLEGMCQPSPDSDILMRFKEGHLLVFKAVADARVYGHQWASKQITRWLIESREECRYNLEAVDLLIRNHLINVGAYDIHLTQTIESAMNLMTIQFAMQLVKMYLIDEKQNGIVTEADLYNTVETLARISSLPRPPAADGLSALMDGLRSTSEPTFLERVSGGSMGSGGPMGMMHSGISQAREFNDPPGLYEKTEYLLRDWVNMFHSPNAGRDSTKAFSMFVHQMNLHGILKTDDLISRFFRLSTEMCVDLCYRVLLDQTSKSQAVTKAKCFHTLDAYVRLIALLVKHSGDAQNTVTKVNLLNKVLGIVTGVLLQDQECRQENFQQLPYHRIFLMLFLELSAPETVLEAINSQILTAFCNTLYYLRPQKAPGFAYTWLELVSHRVFLGRVLTLGPSQKQQGWTMFAQLLISLFKFLAPFLRNVELPSPIHTLYKGTLRVLLVLLHDFPEFLCDYHYGFCDVIASNCIQMRNLILSAFPRVMRLPDPFTPNLKVDMLPEITQAPRVLANFNNLIQPANFKKDLDSYIKTRAPVTFLSELRSCLQQSCEVGARYNIPLINALVLYVGTEAIRYIQSKNSSPNMSTITHSSHMDIFQNLAVDLDTEGRYLFLNAIANQLRYPNSHTHYFSCTLLYLFAEANTEAIQEQITRVLLERLIVNRPHPWGLLITFIELIRNASFKFWNHEFVRCAPEIEKLFESVARSCMHPKPSQEQAAA